MNGKNQYSYSEQDQINIVKGFNQSPLNKTKYAASVGIDRNTLANWIKKYEHIASIEDGHLHLGHYVEKTTVQYDADGKIKTQWLKTSKETQDLLTAVENAIERAKGDIKPYKPKKPKTDKDYEKIATVTGIADAHVGAFACEKQGDPWNLNLAQDSMCFAADYLLDRSPESEVAFIFNVGDYFDHYNTTGQTEKSRHVLDVDGMPYSMIDVGFEILIYIVEGKLKKHNQVIVDSRSGNHDGLMAHVLNKLIHYTFRNEPRVKVNCAHGSRSYHKYGKNLFGLVHGHQTKDKDLPLLMAKEVDKWWYETKEQIWFRGHHHHHDVQDIQGVKIEQLRTICPPNRYAKEGGWLSSRELKVLTYHEEYGRDEEFYCSGRRIRSAFHVD